MLWFVAVMVIVYATMLEAVMIVSVMVCGHHCRTPCDDRSDHFVDLAIMLCPVSTVPTRLYGNNKIVFIFKNNRHTTVKQ